MQIRCVTIKSLKQKKCTSFISKQSAKSNATLHGCNKMHKYMFQSRNKISHRPGNVQLGKLIWGLGLVQFKVFFNGWGKGIFFQNAHKNKRTETQPLTSGRGWSWAGWTAAGAAGIAESSSCWSSTPCPPPRCRCAILSRSDVLGNTVNDKKAGVPLEFSNFLKSQKKRKKKKSVACFW